MRRPKSASNCANDSKISAKRFSAHLAGKISSVLQEKLPGSPRSRFEIANVVLAFVGIIKGELSRQVYGIDFFDFSYRLGEIIAFVILFIKVILCSRSNIFFMRYFYVISFVISIYENFDQSLKLNSQNLIFCTYVFTFIQIICVIFLFQLKNPRLPDDAV